MPEPPASSLRRGLAALRLLGGDEAARLGGLGVVQVSRRLGTNKSQASRTLRVLAESGLVERDPRTLAYRLGWGTFALAARAGRPGLLAAAPAVLRELVQALGESAHLSVLAGGEVLTVLTEAPPVRLHAAGVVGRRAPLWCTSAGRVLLFDHSPADLRRQFGDEPFPPAGPAAPRNVEELARRLATARAHGFALVDEELEEGLAAAAAPVRDFGGQVVAAVNVSLPRFRLDAHRHAAAGRAVLAAAQRLSRTLGSEAVPQ